MSETTTSPCPKCGETGAIDAAEHVEGSLLLLCPGCLQPRDPGPTASEERRAAYDRALQDLAVEEALGELGHVVDLRTADPCDAEVPERVEPADVEEVMTKDDVDKIRRRRERGVASGWRPPW